MKTVIRQRGQVLIIYLTTLFVGGSSLALGLVATGKSLKEIEKSVKVHVQDVSRQQQSLLLLEQWEKEGKALRKEYQKQRETILGLIKKHDAEKSAFKSTIDKMLNMDQQTSKRLLDIQYDLRKNMTAGEWGNVFSHAQK